MCGIVGVSLNNVTERDIELVTNVLLETQIRGKHASGIAWFNGTELNTIKEPIPISELLDKVRVSDLVYDDKLSFIAHIRYSTSNLEYNQPIGDNEFSIVHNGVVTQRDPEFWEEDHGYICSTKNDSELLFHCLKHEENIDIKFPNASYSLLSINSSGVIQNFRNGLRPQWESKQENGIIFASTFDILKRAGANNISKVSTKTSEHQRRYLNGEKRNFYSIL